MTDKESKYAIYGRMGGKVKVPKGFAKMTSEKRSEISRAAGLKSAEARKLRKQNEQN